MSDATSAQRRKQDCRVPGCHQPIAQGKGRSYCTAHECDYDTCARLMADRGRCKRHSYCHTEGCANMRRDVQAAKYCDEHATSINYELREPALVIATGMCLACQSVVTQGQGAGRPVLLCPDHRHLRRMIKRWRYTYNLSDEEVRRLITTAACWICGGDLRWRFAVRDVSRLETIQVDHNHDCCEGERSCGLCVRGLAHQPCNRRLGHIEALLKDVGAAIVHDLIDQLGRDHAPGVHESCMASTDHA